MIRPDPFAHSVITSGAFRCLECGKCTAVCPISRYDRGFSPRRTVGRAIMQRDESLLTDDRLWACLTCLKCMQVCPAAVSYSDLTLAVRAEAHRVGQAPLCTHGEVLHSWMHMMADPELQQERLGWQDGQELRTSEDSDTLYFVGCAPYFQVQFGPIGVDAEAVPQSTVRTLNHLGIEPQVLADERCCGHDLLWEGDVEGFMRLAQLNAEIIKASGAKRVVTSCPECARALKVDYPSHGIDLGVEVLHLSQVVASALTEDNETSGAGVGNGATPGSQGSATFHDPCRLGRHLGVYDAPRTAMRELGIDVLEMPRNREFAECCGTNGWSHCGAANKHVQTERLREAKATGAEVLVTGCLKCQIHFRCALQDRQMGADTRIEIRDLSTMLADALDRHAEAETEHAGIEGE